MKIWQKGILIPMLFLLLSLQQVADSAMPAAFVRPDPCNPDNSAFQSGEEVVYKIYYHWNFVWLPAGEVVFKVAESADEYEITALGTTYPSYEWFFKVDDTYRTRIDKASMLPKVFERDIHEGDFKWYNRIEFDQKTGKVRSFDGPSKREAKPSEGTISGCMHDMMSIIYHLRNVQYGSLRKGDVFPVQIYLDGQSYSLDVQFGGKVSKHEVKGQGDFNALKFSPKVIEGEQFNEGTRMNVWVSDDLNKIPLVIESPVSVGSVKAVLKSYKGLKHPLVSRHR
jgi:hypothetical protein